MNDIVRLNVGGQHFVTTRATLCAVEDSMLAKMFHCESQFAEPAEITKGEIFLDRNPAAFLHVLDFLRDGCRLSVDISSKEMLQRLRADADYFGLLGLVNACDAKLQEKASNEESTVLKEKAKKPTRYEYMSTNYCGDEGVSEWKLIKCVPKEPKQRYIFERVHD